MPNVSFSKIALGAWAALVYAFLYVPILIVVIFAFNTNTFVSVWHGFTTRWFGDAVNDPRFTGPLKTSLEIATLSTAIAIVLGTLAALALARMRKRSRTPFDILVYLTLVVPEIVIAAASLIFFVEAHREVGWLFPPLGFWTILLAHCVFSISLVMLIVRARFVGMGSTLEEASFDLGAGPLSTFVQVTFPRLVPAILAGGLLSFTFSFDDFVLSNFTAGATTVTWPIFIWSARTSPTPELNAFASLMIAATIVVVICAAFALRYGARSDTRERKAGLGAMLGMG